MAKKRKTFLFVTDTDFEGGRLTGGHRRFLELVNEFSKRNEVILVSKYDSGLNGPYLKKIKVIGNSIKFLPAHINKIILICRTLCREKRNIQYDYAISFGPVDTFCYKVCGYKDIVMLLREDYIGYKVALGISSFKMLYFKFMERISVKNAKKIIVQCEDDREALIKRYGGEKDVLRSKIYVQVNNVNASWIKNGKVERNVDKDDQITIAFIGNFDDDRKGHNLLFPAIKKLIDEGYDLKLLVAGDGKQVEQYKEEYKKYKNIVFLGRVKNTGRLLAKSDFEIVPSLMDSCPNTVLEGVGIGVPVYGTNIGGIKEMLQDNEYLFNAEIDSIYKFVKKKIDNKDYINDRTKQENIKKRLTFDWSNEIENIIYGEDKR